MPAPSQQECHSARKCQTRTATRDNRCALPARVATSSAAHLELHECPSWPLSNQVRRPSDPTKYFRSEIDELIATTSHPTRRESQTHACAQTREQASSFQRLRTRSVVQSQQRRATSITCD